LPTGHYRYGIYKCWKCGKEILVFTWPEKDLFDKSGPKVKPVPKTIQYRYSDTVGGKYWANVCPYCGSIQGDHFLHMDSDGPFFGLGDDCCEDTPDAFKRDLMKIASHAAEIGVL